MLLPWKSWVRSNKSWVICSQCQHYQVWLSWTFRHVSFYGSLKRKRTKIFRENINEKRYMFGAVYDKKIWPKWLFNYYRKCMYIYKCSTFSPPNLWQSTLVLLFTKFLASCSCPSVSPMPGASTTSTDRSFLLRGFLAVKVYSTVSLFLVWRKGASLEQFEFSTVQF